YKCCLFLTAGAVENQAGSSELEELGGLAKKMPVVFIGFLVAALAISGVPPLNGFFSKWMIYQGLVEASQSGEPSWVVWITMAMIGSALTLASFMKIAHSVFLGHQVDRPVKKTPVSSGLPILVLAGLCVIFGIFYLPIPVMTLLQPVTGLPHPALSLHQPLLLMVLGLCLGWVLYLVTGLKRLRYAPTFVGGEALTPEMHFSGTEFYQGVKQLPFVKKMFVGAEKKFFDGYEVSKQVIGYITEIFRAAHSGVLGTYLSWILFGLLVVLGIFLKGVAW
ncbi:MAG: hypothetical protein NC911_02830, partial [Candidatus Omnitrophica bacterium]|nr:hypothetical protein [Candidatus Omnitrophota bacterium]